MGAAMGAIIVGGCIEGVLGLFARYWRKLITPIVAAAVSYTHLDVYKRQGLGCSPAI